MRITASLSCGPLMIKNVHEVLVDRNLRTIWQCGPPYICISVTMQNIKIRCSFHTNDPHPHRIVKYLEAD